jgi:hypothetical protein
MASLPVSVVTLGQVHGAAWRTSRGPDSSLNRTRGDRTRSGAGPSPARTVCRSLRRRASVAQRRLARHSAGVTRLRSGCGGRQARSRPPRSRPISPRIRVCCHEVGRGSRLLRQAVTPTRTRAPRSPRGGSFSIGGRSTPRGVEDTGAHGLRAIPVVRTGGSWFHRRHWGSPDGETRRPDDSLTGARS